MLADVHSTSYSVEVSPTCHLFVLVMFRPGRWHDQVGQG